MPVINDHLTFLRDNASLARLIGANDFVLPNYSGFGLANLASSAARWLGVKDMPLPAFDASILRHFRDRYKNVVVVLVDALGYNQLLRLMDENRAPLWQQQLDHHKLIPITSISPSTTASALTTIWTGTCPNTHGVIGYEMWHKQLGMVINNILHSPITYRGDVGSLSKAGFVPTEFMSQVTVGQRFGSQGVESHGYLPASIGNSGLSQMQLPGSIPHLFSAESDLFLHLRDQLNTPSRKPRFFYAYWSDVDTLMHRYGTYDDSTTEQFYDFSQAFFRLLVQGLTGRAKEDTLILLTADHGSIETPANPDYDLANHPGLTRLLRLAPTCEGRLPFLYVRSGKEAEVRAYFKEAWNNEFALLSGQEALELKLLGIGPDHPDLVDRVGDLVAIPKGNAYLWWPDRANTMKGRHGGLHEDEMLVPLFALDW